MAVQTKQQFCGISFAGVAGWIPSAAWMSLCRECCVLLQVQACVTGRSLVQGCTTECVCVCVIVYDNTQKETSTPTMVT
jgi:hypothetical protein